MLLDGGHLARELGGLASGSGAQIEHALPIAAGDAEARELGAAALRPDQPLAQSVLVDALDVQRVRQVGIRDALDSPFLARVAAHDGLGRLVLRLHQRERLVRSELPPPQLRDPVRVRVPERRLLRGPGGQRVDQVAEPEHEAPHDRICERHRALQARGPDKLDRLVDGRMDGDLGERELVRAEPQCGAYGRIELRDRPAAQRFDPVVERPHPLNRPEGEPLRERAIARVERRSSRGEGPVGVGAVLEDAEHGVERRASSGRDHRSPRTNSS